MPRSRIVFREELDEPWTAGRPGADALRPRGRQERRVIQLPRSPAGPGRLRHQAQQARPLRAAVSRQWPLVIQNLGLPACCARPISMIRMCLAPRSISRSLSLTGPVRSGWGQPQNRYVELLEYRTALPLMGPDRPVSGGSRPPGLWRVPNTRLPAGFDRLTSGWPRLPDL